MSSGVNKSLQRRKKLLVEAFGGKCIICGYNKSLRALHFHHKNDKDKRDNISNIIRHYRNYDFIVRELNNCIMVCGNCHSEIHDNLIDVSNICCNINFVLIKEYYILQKKVKVNICKLCGIEFSHKNPKKLYCSKKCFNLHNVKDKPDKDLLKKLIWSIPTTHIAKQYNVSDKAVSGWCKKYKIYKPSRGYWSKTKGIDR
jgi:hypothetical protein